MTRVAYVNGAYVPQAHAMVSMEDRGYHFADGVYEYIAFYNGRILDWDAHIDRLERSSAKLRIAMPMTRGALLLAVRELMARNYREDGGLYMQLTRGVARRDHAFPKHAVKPSLTMTLCAAKTPKAQELENGASVISHPDERWAHCDIKTVSLLANALAKQAATEKGAREAWLVQPDGTVTECASANAYIVKDGTVLTHPANNRILAGISRAVLLELAAKNGVKVEERAYTLDDTYRADEAFLTSTSPNVLPVTRIDGKPIGSGKPGAVTRKLMALYNEHIYAQTGRRFA